METLIDKQLDDYYTYLALREAKISNQYIAKQLGYSLRDFLYLVSLYEFQSLIEYEVPVTSGNSMFQGFPQLAKNIENLLTSDEINEISQFIQNTVNQHNGICPIQEFYHIEQDFSFHVIDRTEICRISELPILDYNRSVIIIMNEISNA